MFEFRLPDLGEGIHEGELLQWHVAQGDVVNEDDPLCDMETDKAAVTIPSPRSGTIATLNANPGDTVKVGDVFLVIDDGSGASAEPVPLSGKERVEAPGKTSIEDSGERSGEAAVEKIPQEAARKMEGSGRVIAAPATRRLARERGIDIRTITGTGPGGRVTPEDLDGPRMEPSQPPELVKSESVGLNIPFLEVTSLPGSDGPEQRIPIRSLRKKTAIKTTSASILVPHVAHMDEIDVTDLEGVRVTYNARHEGKLTLMAFVVKAVAAALREYPMFNASVDTQAREMVHKLFYNIGFAADTPRGLMVPVIHDADRQSLAGIGMRIRYLADRAREGKIEVEELSQGTFTITNVGAIGGTHVFPIINTPETAILGLGRVEKKPVVRNDEIVIRNILPVTLCFDHRAADGAQAAAFVREIKEMLEDSLEFMGRI